MDQSPSVGDSAMNFRCHELNVQGFGINRIALLEPIPSGSSLIDPIFVRSFIDLSLISSIRLGTIFGTPAVDHTWQPHLSSFSLFQFHSF